MKVNARYSRKSLRYLRWVSKAVFLLLFMVPVAYVAGAPRISVYSFLLGGPALTKTSLLVSLTQSPCSVYLSSYDTVNPGLWIVDPLGGLQILLTGKVEIITIVAILLFIIPIGLLGNAFCSWACPIGAIIDSFDKAVEKFFPRIEAKRNKRAMQRRQSKHNEYEKHGKNLVCPSCPVGKVTPKRYGVLANGILASAFVGSAVLRFPVFCVVCPIGIVTRGMLHLRSISSIAGKYLPFILEVSVIPIIAVLASLRERRFWCKKICPMGALLGGAGALSPFIKVRVEEKKCVMKGCPEDCEDGHLDMCLFCRTMDDRKCEEVCPVDINLVDHESSNRCTKCLECYIACDYNAVKIDLLDKPRVSRIGSFFKRLVGHKQKNQAMRIENRSDAAG